MLGLHNTNEALVCTPLSNKGKMKSLRSLSTNVAYVILATGKLYLQLASTQTAHKFHNTMAHGT
jgi:hypothetical protein